MPKLSQETVALILCGLALGALILVATRPGTGRMDVPSPAAPIPENDPKATAAPYYTAYNNVDRAGASYNFGPPVVNVQAQTAGMPGTAGCAGCG